MMVSSLANLFDGTYTTRIQDALGNSGASVTVANDPKGLSVQINGTPTGEGLKLRAEAARANSGGASRASNVSRTQDSISLSPQAQAALVQQKIALQVLLNATSGKSASTDPRKSGSEAAVASRDKSAAVDPADLVSLAQENPTQVIKDAIGAAQAAVAQISTKEGFIAAVSSDPSVLQQFTDPMGDSEKADFLAAIKNGTLDFQSDGLDVGGSMVYTGTSMTSHGGTTSTQFDTTGKHVITFGLGNFGFINVGWPKT